MAERLSEIELEEIQELKEHAENKNTKKKAQQPVLERKARSLRQQGNGKLPNAVKALTSRY